MAKRGPHRDQVDAGVAGGLLLRARNEMGLSWNDLADRATTTSRSVRRWEAGEFPPSKSWREPLAVALGGATGVTWRALCAALLLPVDQMLAKVPEQHTK